jgi:hypothetical protein
VRVEECVDTLSQQRRCFIDGDIEEGILVVNVVGVETQESLLYWGAEVTNNAAHLESTHLESTGVGTITRLRTTYLLLATCRTNRILIFVTIVDTVKRFHWTTSSTSILLPRRLLWSASFYISIAVSTLPSQFSRASYSTHKIECTTANFNGYVCPPACRGDLDIGDISRSVRFVLKSQFSRRCYVLKFTRKRFVHVIVLQFFARDAD